MVNIALSLVDADACRGGDDNNDGAVTVDELMRAALRALEGC